MSFHHVKLAIETQQVSGTHKLLLIILAHMENDRGDGGSWPAIATLADKIGATPRHTKRLVHDLEEKGVIRIVKNAGWHGTNRYFLSIKGVTKSTGGVTPMSPVGVTNSTQRGDTHVTQISNNKQTINNAAPPAPSGAVAALHNKPTNPAPRCKHDPTLPYFKCPECMIELATSQSSDTPSTGETPHD